jgi:hypothetical protein
MAYIGNQNYQAYVTLASQTFTTSGSTTIYSLSYSVTNANNIALYINNVPQQPSVAYTAAGNTLTLTTATSSSMYAVYLGQGIQTTNLPVGVVTTSNLVSGFNLPATQGGTGNTTYTAGNILYASNATTLATLAPGTSGYGLTLNGTTPTWSSVGNTPAFMAYNNGSNTQSITNAIWTEATIYGVKSFDTDSAFNTTTCRFTPQVAGKYFFTASVYTSDFASGFNGIILSKNGSTDLNNTSNTGNLDITQVRFLFVNGIITLNGTTDYVSIIINQQAGVSKNIGGGSGAAISFFGGYRLIGV